VQRIDKGLGSDWSYTRATLTVRRYVSITPRLTWAERALVQNVWGAAPFYDLTQVQTSFKPQEGLGGSGTLRGIPANRYVGKGLALANTELRLRAADFGLLGAPSSLTISGFIDTGRVWSDKVRLTAWGAGVRVGRGPNFVVALDIAHSAESKMPLYIGLGFLF
jgi:outer membrane protein assembly factor BamA